MDSKAKLFGHPIHQMLVVFPLGLLGTSVVFDLLHLALDNDLMAQVAYYLISAGIIAGLIAAPFGTIDWLAIPKGTRAKSIGAMHGVGNLLVVALFAASWWMRREAPAAAGAAEVALSFGGAALSMVTAWLGGELVDRLGVGGMGEVWRAHDTSTDRVVELLELPLAGAGDLPGPGPGLGSAVHRGDVASALPLHLPERRGGLMTRDARWPRRSRRRCGGSRRRREARRARSRRWACR